MKKKSKEVLADCALALVAAAMFGTDQKGRCQVSMTDTKIL